MAPRRRNPITREAAVWVAAATVVAAVLAALAGCRPTGNAPVDVVLSAALGAVVAWLGATAPWWALVVASAGAGAIAAAGGSVLPMLVAWGALGAAVWIGQAKANAAPVRAVVAGAVVQVLLRIEWSPFFLASALVAVVLIAVVAVPGALRRPRVVRRRILWVSAGVLAGLIVAAGGVAAAAVQARPDASRGYAGMLEGLDLVQNGDTTRGAWVLRTAAVDLDAAREALGAPWAQPARLVPGLAQNRDTAHLVFTRAARAAEAAASTLDQIDIDQLRVVDGAVDLTAFDLLEAPLIELERTVAELQDVLRASRSEWLVSPLQQRLDSAEWRAEQLHHQAVGTASLARIGPALLGANGPRRYLVAFTNTAQARGTSGLMGNWAELTIERGKLSQTASGITAELEGAVRDVAPVPVDAPDWFWERYGFLGIAHGEPGVRPGVWINASTTPHMPTVGSVYAQTYEAVTGRAVDGVFILDAAALAALLAITGPVELDEFEVTLDGGNAERFLLVDQYVFAEAERKDLLDTVSELVIERVLTTTLPAPHEMARSMSPAVLGGNLVGYLVRDDEQALLEHVGMDGGMPQSATSGGDTGRTDDVLAVVASNAAGNKIDVFLEREIEYRPVHDPATGAIEANLRVTLHNAAPPGGYSEYVIGNPLGEPWGTNRTYLSIHSPLEFQQMTVDGEPVNLRTSVEQALQVAEVWVTTPPGGSATVEVTLSGSISPGPYQLAYRPQALPNEDRLLVEASTRSGATVFRHEGHLDRRSVLTSSGVQVWR